VVKEYLDGSLGIKALAKKTWHKVTSTGFELGDVYDQQRTSELTQKTKALFVKIVVFEQFVCFDSVNRCGMDASLTASLRLNPSA
jgi:hypothetical protein